MKAGGKVPAVIFDYGGVLSQHQPESAIARLEAMTGVHGQRFRELYWKIRPPYDRGDLDGPAYWQLFGEAVGRSFSPGEIARLIAADTASWIHLNVSLVRWLEDLQAAGVRTAILSNMGIDLRLYIGRRFDWVRRFTCRTFSCEARTIKPEPEIYRRCLAELGVSAEEALFIDDRTENIAAAEALGIRGWRFDSSVSLARRLRAFRGLPPFDPSSAQALA